MAKSDPYKSAKYSIKLHELLKNVLEEKGLEGWVAAKITKASDYLNQYSLHGIRNDGRNKRSRPRINGL